MRKSLVPIIIIVLGFSSILALSRLKKKPVKAKEKVQAPLVSVQSFSPESKTLIVEGNGVVKPEKIVNLIPQVSGQITKLSSQMTNGGKFKKGDLLIQIDPTDYKLRIKNAEALEAQQQMMYLTEKRNHEVAQIEWVEFAKDNPNVKPDSLALRFPQLKLAKANWESAKANLELAKLSLKRTSIRAPFDGMVMSKTADEGQYVSPGVSLAQIYGINKALITVPVKNSELKWLNVDISSKALILGEYAGESSNWEGKLVRKEASLDNNSRMSNLIIEINSPQDLEKKLPFGLFVNVKIDGVSYDNIYTIPRHLIRNENTILLEENNSVKFQTIKVLKYYQETALVNDGLTSNDNIIISRLDIATPGMKVRTSISN